MFNENDIGGHCELGYSSGSVSLNHEYSLNCWNINTLTPGISSSCVTNKGALSAATLPVKPTRT